MTVARLESVGVGGRARTARPVPPRRARAVAALVLFAAHLVGCVHYVPVDPATLPTGADVVLDITETGRTELREVIGPAAERVEGRLLARTDTELLLSVTSVRHTDLLDPVRWSGERVEIARDLIADVQHRTLDRTRSFIVVGLVVGLLTVVSLGGFGVSGQEDNGNGPTGNGGVDQ